MGLDLMPMGKPKPGFESDFLLFLEKKRQGTELNEAEVERFQANTIPPYETLNAPRVGFDAAANDWIVESRRTAGGNSLVAQIISENNGYFVLQLLKSCDGVPEFSNGGLYEGVDRTSFRGSFLDDCSDYLAREVIAEAWEPIKNPAAAVTFGSQLLEFAYSPPTIVKPKSTFLNRMFGQKIAPSSLQQQVEILKQAGKWYIFWGNRGHHIEAWF